MLLRRLGKVFDASMGPAWMVSHAAYPTPMLMAPDRIRVFMVARDADNRGSVGWVDVSADDPTCVCDVSEFAALGPGELGAFDDRGISIGSICAIDGRLHMYYLGWNKSADVPFRNAIGIAVDTTSEGRSFSRVFRGPVLDRNPHDPFTLSYPYVTPPAGRDDEWQMVYGTSQGGGTDEREMAHVLSVATSSDGYHWCPTGARPLALAPGEYGMSRPWPIQIGDRHLLLFSSRQDRYRIGAALCEKNGMPTARWSDDVFRDVHPLPAEDDFDSEEQTYPAVVVANGRRYLFYNGNRYGLTGFGVAEISEEPLH